MLLIGFEVDELTKIDRLHDRGSEIITESNELVGVLFFRDESLCSTEVELFLQITILIIITALREEVKRLDVL